MSSWFKNKCFVIVYKRLVFDINRNLGWVLSLYNIRCIRYTYILTNLFSYCTKCVINQYYLTQRGEIFFLLLLGKD